MKYLVLILSVPTSIIGVAWHWYVSSEGVPENSHTVKVVSELAAAEALTTSIEAHTAELRAANSGMSVAAEARSPILRQVVAAVELENLAALHPVVAELRQMSRTLLANKDGLAASIRALKSDYKAAPAVFQAAAESYRGYAESETYEDLKKDYASLAVSWERLAVVVAEHESKLSSDTKDVEEVLDYLSRCDLFLMRLDEHLASFPRLQDGGAWKQQLGELQEYVRRFEQLRGSLRGVNGRLHAKEQPGQAVTNAVTVEPEVKKLFQYTIERTTEGRVRISLPHAGALLFGERVAIFRSNHALAGWTTVEEIEDRLPVAWAKTDLELRAGDYVALPLRRG
jgi:hypothetical protein